MRDFTLPELSPYVREAQRTSVSGVAEEGAGEASFCVLIPSPRSPFSLCLGFHFFVVLSLSP